MLVHTALQSWATLVCAHGTTILTNRGPFELVAERTVAIENDGGGSDRSAKCGGWQAGVASRSIRSASCGGGYTQREYGFRNVQRYVNC